MTQSCPLFNSVPLVSTTESDPTNDAAQNLYIGTAGWSLARAASAAFPTDGTHLERYATVFPAVEINSSFHRPHKPAIYERWAAAVPDRFRFAVKIPKSITHEKRLSNATEPLISFLAEVSSLGHKLGCLLVQLPPSLEFEASIAENFFSAVQRTYSGDIFLEPRNKTWFGSSANRLLQELRIGRVAADPAVIPVAGEPGGSPGKVYFRLHGSPQTYYSAYTDSYLDGLAFRLRAYARAGVPVWCMFDNTIRGAATLNALYIMRKISLADPGEGRP